MSGNYVESKKMAKSSAGIAAQRISENNREIVSELEIIMKEGQIGVHTAVRWYLLATYDAGMQI